MRLKLILDGHSCADKDIIAIFEELSQYISISSIDFMSDINNIKALI
jgi:hypothetical protein